ncbi:MAG TPA: TlpA disulfide reductase family protein [Pirellulales bacterium]
MRRPILRLQAIHFPAAWLMVACLAIACLLTAGCQQQSSATPMLPSDTRAGGRGNSETVGSEVVEREVADTVRGDRDAEAAPVTGAAAEASAGGAAVTLQVLDYAGIERLIASHRGKVVVMDAWSTSCPPCVQEFPKLVALSHEFGKDQLGCISLSFDYEGIGQPADKLPRVAAFLEQQQATFDNVLSSEESDTLYHKFHLASVPAVFVYDKTGALRHRFDNQKAKSAAENFTYEDVERLVATLVAEPGPADAQGPDADPAP